MRILVTRPVERAKLLCQKMQEQGFTPHSFPVMEILPTAQQAILREQVRRLSEGDRAIFISRSAVQYGGQAILNYWKQFPKLLYFAIGPGTQHSLQQMGCATVWIPPPPFESESLLEHPQLQNLKGKKIFIFQGNSGRKLLFETLVERLGVVVEVECYQRKLPRLDKTRQEVEWQKNSPEGILVTSREGLKNLMTLMGQVKWAECLRLPFVVVGARLQQEARRLGVQRIITAQAADDATLIEALIMMRNKL